MLIDKDAKHETLIWLQKGDASKPVVVFVHAIFGTPIGS